MSGPGYARSLSVALIGLEGAVVEVEADIATPPRLVAAEGTVHLLLMVFVAKRLEPMDKPTANKNPLRPTEAGVVTRLIILNVIPRMGRSLNMKTLVMMKLLVQALPVPLRVVVVCRLCIFG